MRFKFLKEVLSKCSLFLMFCLLATFVAGTVFGQLESPSGNISNSEYVQTTRDTVAVDDWVWGSVRQGLITNEDSAGTNVSLEVFFSDRSGALDSNRYFRVPPGKTLHFKTSGSKIFRRAFADSLFSQVLFGDVELSYIEQLEDEGKLLTHIEAERIPKSEFGNEDRGRKIVYAEVILLCPVGQKPFVTDTLVFLKL